MAIPNTNGIFIHEGLNCSSSYVPTAQSIPMSPSDSTTVKTVVDNKSDLSIIADEYDTSATYTIGDFVIYDKVLYKCIMYSTTGDWDSTRWVAVNSKDSGINLKNSSGNNLVKIWENTLGEGVISLYDKTTGYDTVSLHGNGDIDVKSITVMTSGYSNSGRIELTTTQSNSGYISLRDDNKNTPIELNADDGSITCASVNTGSGAVTLSSKVASSGGTDLSLVTTGEKYSWNNKADSVPEPAEYDPTVTYNAGDVVTYNNAIYQCNTYIYTAEAWNPSHWNLVTPDIDYLHSINPVGYGSFSLNRKANTTIGNCSFAEGYNCTASSNQGSHAEGYNTTASSSAAHAEGSNTTASGLQSHAEGLDTVASGHNGSHAEGRDTQASGVSAHAEGSNTVASGNFSHSEGLYTTSNHRSQHTFGEYNVLDTSTATASDKGNYVEIVGNGTATNARSNARTLDWSGNEVLAGGLKLNGTEDVITTSKSASSSGTDLSLVTTGEKYIWNNKSDLQLGTTSTTALRGDTTYAGSSTAGGSATSAAKLDTATAGSATQPCYFANGVPSACTYSLNKTVPSNAVFTDTQVTQSLSSTNAYYPILFSYAGNADKTANVTNICYRNNSVYINPSTGNIRATTFNGYTLAGACAYSATTSVASGGGALVTSGGVYTAVAAKQNKITRTSTSRYFTSKTSMAYTGLSLTCPANHIYLVQAWFRHVNGAPRYVGACHSSTTYAFYDCVAASTDAGTTNAGHSSLSFMLTPGETIYYWAMYYNATQNFISESVVDITIS